jgi:hypothetical protein
VDKKPPGRGEKKKKESMEVVFVLAVVLFRFCSFQKKPGSARRLVVSLPCGKVWAKEKPQGRAGEGKEEEKGKKRKRRSKNTHHGLLHCPGVKIRLTEKGTDAVT